MECHFGLRIPKRHSHVFTAIIQFTVNIVFNYLASILNSLNSMIRISQIKQIFNQQTKRKKTNEKQNDILKKKRNIIETQWNRKDVVYFIMDVPAKSKRITNELCKQFGQSVS